MPKKVSEDVFLLVKSLSASEKRYFRLNFSEKEDAKSIRLFKYLDNSNAYDENAFLVANPDLIPTQISNLKGHLYRLILGCLRQYDREKKIELRSREMVDYVQILLDRGLYMLAYDQVKKAKKLLKKTESLELHLDLLNKEKQLLNSFPLKDYEQRTRELIEAVDEANQKITFINQLTNLSAKLSAIYLKEGYIQNDGQYLRVKQIFRGGIPDFEEEALSLYEKLNLYRLYVNYYYFTEEMTRGYIYAKKWLALYESYPHLKEQQADDYLSAINQVMIAEFRIQRYSEFVAHRKLIYALNLQISKSTNTRMRQRILKYLFVHEFNRLFMLGKFSYGLRLLHRLGGHLEDFIKQTDEHSRIILYYKLACLHFGASDFSGAINWLNKVMSDEQAELRNDIHAFARILSLIAHYELRNLENIEYFIRSAYRYLLKEGALNQFQRYLLSFLRKLPKAQTDEELQPIFKQLLDQLAPLQYIRYEKRSFVYFDIIAWLESKIMGKTVEARIQEKARVKIKNTTQG